jgi:hypothetical protein
MPWKRLRRRTMAPSRPALYPDQIGLFVLTVAALAGGIYAALRYLL